MPIKLNGSTSGYSQLQAAAAAASNTLTLPASNGTIIADDGSGNVTITGSAYLATTSGNVGIGTSSPGYKLDVQSSSASLNLYSTTTTNISYINFRNSSYNYVGVENSVGGGLFTGSSAYALALGTISAYPIKFVTSGIIRATIDSSGNVQVGGTTVANTVGYVNSRTNARAWARWTGSTVAIASSYNVSSITRSSAGQYVVNFTTALADANYAPMMSCSGDVSYNGSGVFPGLTSAPTTSSFAMWIKSYSGTAVDSNVVQIAVFGN